jgi:hypothetical protein
LDTQPIVAGPRPGTKRPPGKQRLKSLKDLDRRTAAARNAYALRDQIVLDLGGPSALSAMQKVLVDHVATFAAALGDLAAKYLAGETADMIQYAVLVNSQRRLLADLGLERRSVDVTQNLSSYLASHRPQPPIEDQEDEGAP